MNRHQETARVVRQAHLGAGYHVLVLESPEVAAEARPGQFAMVATRPATERLVDPLLLRPFSFLSRDADAGRIEIFYRELGRGTRLLTNLSEGTPLAVVGPLGRPWPAPEGDEVALVAGGVGMPPLLDLALARAAEGDPARVHVFYGGRSKEHIHLLDRFEAAGVVLHLSTDDGSLGLAGTNVAALDAWLEAREGEGAPTVYACGPDGMLRATAELARRRALTAFVSLEAPMACGIGVCRGCAVPHAAGGFKMVCTDGPVFRAEEVYF